MKSRTYMEKLREIIIQNDTQNFAGLVQGVCNKLLEPLATVDLIDHIWPLVETLPDDIPHRLRIYRVLNSAVAEGLLDGHFYLEPGTFRGKPVNRKKWQSFDAGLAAAEKKRRMGSAVALASAEIIQLRKTHESALSAMREVLALIKERQDRDFMGDMPYDLMRVRDILTSYIEKHYP